MASVCYLIESDEGVTSYTVIARGVDGSDHHLWSGSSTVDRDDLMDLLREWTPEMVDARDEAYDDMADALAMYRSGRTA